MSTSAQLKKIISDPLSPRSLAARARNRRWEMLKRRFPDVMSMRVLDLGGWIASWSVMPEHPAEVVCLNLDAQDDRNHPWATALVGDACQPPDGLRSERFDLAFSNSLIEHVGGHARCEAFADVVRHAAPHHWIQTPYRYFPLEPHWLFPGFQQLPQRVRASVAVRWPLSFARSTPAEAVHDVLAVQLLSVTEMRHYFPDSELLHERVFGITKSVIAIR